MKIIKLFLLILISACLSACSAMQDSAGKAFANAGSVVNSGGKKMYIKEGEAKDNTERAKEEEDEEFRRY